MRTSTIATEIAVYGCKPFDHVPPVVAAIAIAVTSSIEIKEREKSNAQKILGDKTNNAIDKQFSNHRQMV